jgi:endonuclease-3 related protein
MDFEAAPVSSTTGMILRQFHDALHRAYGPQGWWPGRTRTEIVVGAILTQNTNWRNVEKAIAQLRAAGMLDWAALRDVPVADLAQHIRPAGYYRVKARRLKNFVAWLWDFSGGDFDSLASRPMNDLRGELQGINGIGPETADSILLYALEMPTFVVDAYTGRMACRHGLIDGEVDYETLKTLFEDSLPADAQMFNEYHALIVAVGKGHCKPRALCEGCPLEPFEHDATACCWSPARAAPGGSTHRLVLVDLVAYDQRNDDHDQDEVAHVEDKWRWLDRLNILGQHEQGIDHSS